MAIDVSQNEDISGEGKYGGGEKVGSVFCRKRANRVVQI